MAHTKDQLAEALVAPSTVDKKQFLQVFKLRDSNIRGSCCLQAFNPLIPADADRSGLPIAVLRWVLTNETDLPVEAAICGKVDYLRGLKENVIMGRLIPAGTGIPTYKRLTISVDSADDKAGDRLESTVGGGSNSMPLAEVASGRDE